MEKDLIIDVSPARVTIALLEDHRLMEISQEQNTSAQSIGVGDVYLGKVKKVMPALNAAFVDIGDNKDAFIHYLDLGLNFKGNHATTTEEDVRPTGLDMQDNADEATVRELQELRWWRYDAADFGKVDWSDIHAAIGAIREKIASGIEPYLPFQFQ